MVGVIKLFASKFLKLFLFSQFLSCSVSNFHLIDKKNASFYQFNGIEKNNILSIDLILKQNSIEQKTRLIVDTGSSISILNYSNEFKKKYSKKIEINSIHNTFMKDFQFIDVDFYDLDKKILLKNFEVSSAFLGEENFQDGILGNDFLSKFSLFLELPEKIIIVNKTFQQTDIDGFTRVPMRFDGNHILFQIELDRKKFDFLLDTGAGISCLDESITKQIRYKKTTGIKVFGTDGNTIESESYILDKLCIDENLCAKNVDFIIKNLENIFYPDKSKKIAGILGKNWIEKYSILIDFQSKSLYIKRR